MHHESVGWHTKGTDRSHVIKGKSGHKDVEKNVVMVRKEAGYSLRIYVVKARSVSSIKSTSRR